MHERWYDEAIFREWLGRQNPITYSVEDSPPRNPPADLTVTISDSAQPERRVKGKKRKTSTEDNNGKGEDTSPAPKRSAKSETPASSRYGPDMWYHQP